MTEFDPSIDWFSAPAGHYLDATWFPVDLRVREKQFCFLQINEAVVTESVFLDGRILAPWRNAVPVALADLPSIDLPQRGAGLIFHTSFCCSTLLTRALHLPGHSIALREPLALRRLADARWEKVDAEDLVQPALALLGRPWSGPRNVVVKPTHLALPLAADMLAAMPTSRGIALTSTLESFLVSNIKKSPATQAKVPELIARLVMGTGLEQRITDRLRSKPEFLSFVAAQWCIQQFWLAQLLQSADRGQVLLLQEAVLLQEFGQAVVSASEWLHLNLPQSALLEHAIAVSGRHAKHPIANFDQQDRANQSAEARAHFGQQIDACLRWTEQELFPIISDELNLLAKPDFSLNTK